METDAGVPAPAAVEPSPVTTEEAAEKPIEPAPTEEAKPAPEATSE